MDMPSHSRRTLLRGLAGVATVASVPTVVTARQSDQQLTLDWHRTVATASRVHGLATPTETRASLLLESHEGTPSVATVGTDGATAWTYEGSSGTNESKGPFAAAAPVGNGGLYLARAGGNDTLDVLRVSDEPVLEAQHTYDISQREVGLVRPYAGRLVLTNTTNTTHMNSTTVYGFDPPRSTPVWENETFEAPDSGQADEMYHTRATTPYRDGSVIGGATLSRDAWVARLKPGGETDWSVTRKDTPLQRVDDIAVDTAATLVAVGPRDGETDDAIRAVGIDDDGEVKWTTDTAFGVDAFLSDIHLARLPERGFVATADLQSEAGFVVALLDSEGRITESVRHRPGDTEVSLDASARAGRALVVAGQTDEGDAWAGAVTDLPERAESRPQTATGSVGTETPTPTSSPTERSESPSSPETISQRTESTETTESGSPGFGLLGGLSALAGVGYLVKRGGRE